MSRLYGKTEIGNAVCTKLEEMREYIPVTILGYKRQELAVRKHQVLASSIIKTQETTAINQLKRNFRLNVHHGFNPLSRHRRINSSELCLCSPNSSDWCATIHTWHTQQNARIPHPDESHPGSQNLQQLVPYVFLSHSHRPPNNS